MRITEVPTYTATIYCGMKEGYDGFQHNSNDCLCVLKEYVDVAGLCVSVDSVHFQYTRGFETGVRVTLINYPRFPSTKEEIEENAIKIATLLKKEFKQYRVSIVLTDKTLMLEDEE